MKNQKDSQKGFQINEIERPKLEVMYSAAQQGISIKRTRPKPELNEGCYRIRLWIVPSPLFMLRYYTGYLPIM